MKKISNSAPGILLSTLVSLGVGSVSTNAATPSVDQLRHRPNIVYILADDMGCGDVSAYNSASAWATPNLDRLAKEGIRFTDAHSSSAVCTPSRYAIMTGRYNWRSARKSGVGGGLSPALIESGRLTVPALLQQHGYATAMVGKWHLGLDWVRTGKNAVPTTDDPSDGEASGRTTAAAAAENAVAIDYSKPFGGGPLACGFQYFVGISASLDMPPYAWLRGDRVDATMPLQPIKGSKLPAMWRAGLAAEGFAHIDVLPREAQEAVNYIGKQDGKKPFFLYLSLTAPHTPIVPAKDFSGRTHTTEYGDFCAQVDGVVGQILAALAARHLDENTLVIFTADNGCSPSANFDELRKFHHDPQAGLRGEKADVYEGGHRVPFLVRWPGHVPAGRTSADLVYQGELDTKVDDNRSNYRGMDLGGRANGQSSRNFFLWYPPVLVQVFPDFGRIETHEPSEIEMGQTVCLKIDDVAGGAAEKSCDVFHRPEGFDGCVRIGCGGLIVRHPSSRRCQVGLRSQADFIATTLSFAAIVGSSRANHSAASSGVTSSR